MVAPCRESLVVGGRGAGWRDESAGVRAGPLLSRNRSWGIWSAARGHGSADPTRRSRLPRAGETVTIFFECACNAKGTPQIFRLVFFNRFLVLAPSKYLLAFACPNPQRFTQDLFLEMDTNSYRRCLTSCQNPSAKTDHGLRRKRVGKCGHGECSAPPMTDLISAVSGVATAIGVFVAAWQLWETRRQSVTTFEDSLAREYREIATTLPTNALLGRELPAEEYAAHFDTFYRYFDFSNEQAFLHQCKRIDKKTWKFWCAGIASNLKRPAFKKAWNEICQAVPGEFTELRALFPPTSQSVAEEEERAAA